MRAGQAGLIRACHQRPFSAGRARAGAGGVAVAHAAAGGPPWLILLAFVVVVGIAATATTPPVSPGHGNGTGGRHHRPLRRGGPCRAGLDGDAYVWGGNGPP
jgi:hypothetical protein